MFSYFGYKIDCECFKSSRIERIEMLNWDRQILEWQMKKFGWSTYAVAWIAFIKGIIIGLLVYHFFIN